MAVLSPFLIVVALVGVMISAVGAPCDPATTWHACEPQRLTMRAALETLQHTCYPGYPIVFIPIWAGRVVAVLGNRRELQPVLPFFEYCEKTGIILSGSPAEANALLGAQWASENLCCS